MCDGGWEMKWRHWKYSLYVTKWHVPAVGDGHSGKALLYRATMCEPSLFNCSLQLWAPQLKWWTVGRAFHLPAFMVSNLTTPWQTAYCDDSHATVPEALGVKYCGGKRTYCGTICVSCRQKPAKRNGCESQASLWLNSWENDEWSVFCDREGALYPCQTNLISLLPAFDVKLLVAAMCICKAGKRQTMVTWNRK